MNLPRLELLCKVILNEKTFNFVQYGSLLYKIEFFFVTCYFTFKFSSTHLQHRKAIQRPLYVCVDCSTSTSDF